MARANAWDAQCQVADEADGDEAFKPLTLEEAQKLLKANPAISLWSVVVRQLLVGVVVAFIAFALTGRPAAGWSAFYGALAVVIPAALFARGLLRQRASANAGAALAGFFVWELIKVALTVAMLVAAPQWVEQLNWLALLAGFVVTMKVSWVAVWLRLRHSPSIEKI